MSVSTVLSPSCTQLQDKVLDVRNPFDNKLIGTLACWSRAEILQAIELADSYDYRLTAWQRYKMLTRFCELLDLHATEFIELISEESGKTLRDSEAELKRSRQTFVLSAEEAKRINGEILPIDAVEGLEKGLALALREPIGPVAAITPFNYPLNLVAHKVGPALAANNPVIVKPSESTPLTALKMQELLIQAGVPIEMFQVVIGNPADIAEVLATDSRIRKISFTGSTNVGKAISKLACLKSVSMELGGNDPMIVLNDANLDKAIPAAIDGAFGNNGQRCTSVKRFIVENGIADKFIEKFIAATKRLKIGNQFDPSTDIGPLINVQAAVRIEKRIQATIEAGSILLHGGRRDGAIFQPTVLDHVTMQHPIVQEETFGPVAPIIRVDNFEEAIQVANDTAFGLQSGIFTNDLSKAHQAIARIQAGAVMINKAPGFRAEHLPFGGIKDSGLGKEGVRYAIEAMTQLKTVVM